MDRIKNQVRYYPNDIFIDKVNQIIDVKNGDSTANISKLKKSSFINNRSNSMIVPAINKLIDGEDVKINTNHLAKNIDKVIVSKINEVAKVEDSISVISVNGEQIPASIQLYIGDTQDFNIMFDKSNYVCELSDFSCDTAGVTLSLLEGYTNVLQIDVADTVTPDTEVNVFFKSQKIMHVTAVAMPITQIEVNELVIDEVTTASSNILDIISDVSELVGSRMNVTTYEGEPVQLGVGELSNNNIVWPQMDAPVGSANAVMLISSNGSFRCRSNRNFEVKLVSLIANDVERTFVMS